MERFNRQTMLPQIGEEGQEKLAKSKVLIVGLGGLGAPASLYLAAAGIGRLGIADIDTVSVSNLQRQVLYGNSQIGLPKVECAKERLRASAMPECEIVAYPEGLTPENADGIVADYDLVLDCTDSFATRLLIDDACVRMCKPWVYGSIEGFVGQVTVFNHQARKRYRDLYPEADELAAMPKRILGVVGPTPGVTGSLQAMEAIKLLVGTGDLLDGRILVADMLSGDFNVFEF